MLEEHTQGSRARAFCAGIVAVSTVALAAPIANAQAIANAQEGEPPANWSAPAVDFGNDDAFSYSYFGIGYKGLDFDDGDGGGLTISIQQELVGNFFIGVEGTFAQLTQTFTFPTFDVDGGNVVQGTGTRESDADYARGGIRLGRYFHLQDNLHVSISGFVGGTATTTDIEEISSSEDAEAVVSGTLLARLRVADPVELFAGLVAEGSGSDFETDEGVGVIFGAALGNREGIQLVVGGEALDSVTRYSGGIRLNW